MKPSSPASYEASLTFPRADIWSYHTRQGAIARLIPPFVPISLIEAPSSLARGMSTYRLPAGLITRTHYRLGQYFEGYQFGHVCTHAPMKMMNTWQHTIRLSETDSTTTTLTHTISCSLPHAAVKQYTDFYRRRITEDLTLRSHVSTGTPRVAVFGADTLLGADCAALLDAVGADVTCILEGRSGSYSTTLYKELSWHPHHLHASVRDFSGYDVFLDLYDAPLNAHACTSRTALDRRYALSALANAVGARLICFSDITAPSVLEEATPQAKIVRLPFVLSGREGLLPILQSATRSGLGAKFFGTDTPLPWISAGDCARIFVAAVYACDSQLCTPVAREPLTGASLLELHDAGNLPRRWVTTLNPALFLKARGVLKIASDNAYAEPAFSGCPPLLHNTVVELVSGELGGKS